MCDDIAMERTLKKNDQNAPTARRRCDPASKDFLNDIYSAALSEDEEDVQK